MSGSIRYVDRDTTPMYREADAGTRRLVHELLWGDRVEVLDEGAARSHVRARGLEGWVDPRALGDTPLLEIYFIDVGQGDGVLVRCPDDRHVLVDGGFNRAKQPSGKNAADFVDWKFVRDYRRREIVLDAMISSHCDADHYGGLWDLLNPDAHHELDARRVQVGAFYHAGVSWWDDGGRRNLGPSERGHLVRLLDDEASVASALRPGASPMLQGEWADFLRCVRDARCAVRRLSHRHEYLPAFERNDVATGRVAFRVLGPVEPEPGRLLDLGSDSRNTNGNSIILRLDYGRVRVLLTGDLNRASQRRLLEAYTGRRMEFACDVAKACHHGSADVSYEFLSTMSPAATVISSGDSESHAHPRPSIVAASALAGHVRLEKDAVVTPLVYSTEISRSVRMGRITHIEAAGVGLADDRLDGHATADVHFAEVGAGDLRAKRGRRRLAGSYVVAGMIYGLVNVRTNGERILCATLNEKKRTWDCQGFRSRF